MDIHFVMEEGDYLSSPPEGKLHPGGLDALRPCWEGALHLSPTHVDKEGVANLGQVLSTITFTFYTLTTFWT